MEIAALANGARVRIRGWGLDGLVMVITAQCAAEPDYFNIAFEHNGNPMPSNWHRDLMRPA